MSVSIMPLSILCIIISQLFYIFLFVGDARAPKKNVFNISQLYSRFLSSARFIYVFHKIITCRSNLIAILWKFHEEYITAIAKCGAI